MRDAKVRVDRGQRCRNSGSSCEREREKANERMASQQGRDTQQSWRTLRVDPVDRVGTSRKPELGQDLPGAFHGFGEGRQEGGQGAVVRGCRHGSGRSSGVSKQLRGGDRPAAFRQARVWEERRQRSLGRGDLSGRELHGLDERVGAQKRAGSTHPQAHARQRNSRTDPFYRRSQ